MADGVEWAVGRALKYTAPAGTILSVVGVEGVPIFYTVKRYMGS
jgi:hypothetical protein